jgi:hypothetical protein
MKKTALGSLMAVLLLSSGVALAKEKPKAPPAKQAPVTVTTQSYQQMPKRNKKGKILRDKNGKPILEWVKATKVVPGTVVKYVDTVGNHTNQTIENLAIKNPINVHLAYVAESAASETNATITYSVDGGKHFDVPEKLYVVGLDKKKHLAQPKEYNAIQWVIASVPPESNVTVEFKAKLK